MSYLFDNGTPDSLDSTTTPVTAFPLSLSCWFYNDDLTAYNAMVTVQDDRVPAHRLAIIAVAGALAGDPVYAQSSAGGDAVPAVTTAGATINTWHHACGVFTSAELRAAYIDGGNKDTATEPYSPVNINSVTIGRLGDSTPSGYYSGRLAEVAIWNIALTDAEVAMLGEGYSALFVRPANLKVYKRLVRGSQELMDGLSFAATGSPSVANHPRIIYPSPRLTYDFAGAGVAFLPYPPPRGLRAGLSELIGGMH